MNIIEVQAKTLYTRTKIPGADWAVNPYTGCSFACPYCYAKFMCRFRPHGSWGTWVEAKTNAPQLANKQVDGTVLMSTICDPYQPVEAKLKITRRILESMPKDNSLEILTKSPLVTRDIDILKQFDDVKVGLTVNDLPRFLEPGTPSKLLRIQALKKLNDAGISTYAFISPVIPEVFDVINIVDETEDFVDFYMIELLNTKGAGKDFLDSVKSRYPDALGILKNKRSRDIFVESLRAQLGDRSYRLFSNSKNEIIYRA